MVMRLQTLRLAPYGCFADQELEFAAPGTVDLVLGPNAAGKSTLARGTLGLVFGIDARTPDAHTFPYADLRVSARVQLGDKTIEGVRRKGRVGTLTAPDGHGLPDDLFESSLGGLSKGVFEKLFMIDNASLKQGAAELLQGKGEVGASLFAAAAGIARLHETVERFDGEAKASFNPGGRKDPVHNALRDLNDAEKRQRAATLRPPKHREMERELERLEAECEELRAAVGDREAEREQLQRKRRLAPLVARHYELAEERAGLGAIPDLPEDAPAQRSAAEASKRGGERRLERAREMADRLADELRMLEVDEALLARTGEVRELHQQLPVLAKAAADLPRRERDLHAAEEALKVAAATAGVGAEQVEELRRPESTRRRLDQAIAEHGRLAERRRAAKEALRDAGVLVAEAEMELKDATEPQDVAPLEAAIKAALADTSMQAQERDERLEAERLVAEAEDGVSRLTPGPASLEELKQAAVPGPEAVAALEEEAARIREAERDLAAEGDRLEAAREELREQRDQLELGATVPTGADLAKSRKDRDQAWASLRPALEGGPAPGPAVVGDYETRVVGADSVADAQVAGAAQLTQAAGIEATERKLARQVAAIEERAVELAGRREKLAADWARLWEAAGFDPPALAHASGWLERRDRALELAAIAERHRVKAQAMSETVAAHAETLTARLAEHGVRTPEDASMAELLELAERTADDMSARARAREELVRGLTEARRARASAQRERDAAEAAWGGWEAAWPDVLDAAGLPAETTSDTALEVGRAIADGLGQLARISELRRSVDGIERDRRQFEKQVKKLCAALAPELSKLEPEAAIATLAERLTTTEDAATSRSNLLTQQAGAEAELGEAEVELQQAADALEDLRLLGGCDQLADLPTVEAKSARARELNRELDQLERQAIEVGEDRFDRVREELAGFDAAEAAARLRLIEAEIDERSTRRDEVKTTLGERTAELCAAESDISAVEAAEDAELAKAELEQAAREHARAKLAALVVRRAMERYRRLHQDPLLKRANALFARFTLGSFVELFVDHEPGVGAILMGRQRDRQLKKVEEMSSGTREQLFLALRLAAVERYVATVGAVPVIFDDAFLESDEQRSGKIFEALAELAGLTQVIVLTHRASLAELGKRVLGERVAVVELPDLAPVLRAAEAGAAAA